MVSKMITNKKIDPKFLSIAFTNKDLCTRSGTCVAVCPENALYIGKDFYPQLISEKCTECGICEQTCPGGSLNFKELNEITFKHDLVDDSFDGNVLKTFVGYSTDEKIRAGGAGGGVITGLLWDLLRRKIVDGCVVTRMDPKRPYYGEVFIARTYEELLESQQSKYIVIPVNSILKEIENLPVNMQWLLFHVKFMASIDAKNRSPNNPKNRGFNWTILCCSYGTVRCS